MATSSESNPNFVESTDDVTSDTFDIDEITANEKQNSKKPREEELNKAISDIIRSKHNVSKIFTYRKKRGKMEFFVKFKNSSYRDCDWIPESELLRQISGKMLYTNFMKNYPSKPPRAPFFPEEYTIPERVIGKEYVECIAYYAVKWTGLDYDEITYELPNEILDELIAIYETSNTPPPSREYKKPQPSEFKSIKKPNKSKSEKSLREYQLQGVNFLINSWYNNKNPILADEMGLGKTCQASYFLNYLFTEAKLPGPYLILAPLSTIPHWERELKDWTNFKVLNFTGAKERRNILKKYEIFYEDTHIPKFDVLLTTFEYIIKEVKTFRQEINWRCLIVDEAHRLKNFDSKITHTMNNYHADFKVLLTGTPLQNNTKELWTLLNFLDTENFGSHEVFNEKFGKLQDAQQIQELQAILRPLMLRRMKGDVEKNIIPMDEVIIECGMSKHQRAYYQNIYTKNMEYLSRGAHSKNSSNLMNVCMELRKVCNHPYLIKGAEDQILIEREEMLKLSPNQRVPANFVDESLIRSAGKMILLDKLLVKLKKDGHRVLIFSQMTKMLDILQDFLNYRKYKFERIDGSVKTEDRQSSIDRFNDEKSDSFIFLLCTKAGGLGINLVSADTVVIYDSDWNPQNDIQATARCHRIGQKKKVTAYRFITAKSYERKMFDIASLKRGLDTAVLETNEKWQNDTKEIEKLLKVGAYYAFEENDDTYEKFNEEDIDTIISKSKLIQHDANTGDGSTFSKAVFDVQENDDVDVTAPDFWKRYMPEQSKDEEMDAVAANLSIAERLRLARGETPIPPPVKRERKKTGPPQYKRSNFKWTRQKLNSMQQAFLKFGWGRWAEIGKEFGEELPEEEIQGICYVFITYYNEYLTLDDSFILHLLTTCGLPEMHNFYKYFKTKFRDELISLVGSNLVLKANRLSQLETLRLAFENGDISNYKFDNINENKPTTQWSVDDDYNLLKFIHENGFGTFTDFIKNYENVNRSMLIQRFDVLIASIKQQIEKEKELNLDDFSTPSTKFTERDQEFVHYGLISLGYTTAEDFKLKTGFLSKTVGVLQPFIESFIAYCKRRIEVPDDVLPLGVIAMDVEYDKATRVVERLNFFEKVRDFVANAPEEMRKGRDWQLICEFASTGFIDMDTNPLYLQVFGPELVEAKLYRKIQIVMHPPAPSDRPAPLMSGQTPELEFDADGQPILPAALSNTFILRSLGRVVWDRPGFHGDRYVYPDGYVSEKLYFSCVDVGEKVWYRNTVVDTGDELPLFRVESPDGKMSWEANKPSNCWLAVLRAIEERKRELGLPGNRVLSISGPEMFGFANPIVCKLMKKMPGADKCRNFHGVDNNDDDVILPSKIKIPENPNPPEPVSSTKSEAPKLLTRAMIMKPKDESMKLQFNFSQLIANKGETTKVFVGNDAVLQKTSLPVVVTDESNKMKNAIEAMSKLI